MVADPSGTTATWTVGRDDVGNLVSKIFDPRRGLPIILVSPASDTGAPRVDPELLAGRVRATVAVLGSVDASQALSDTVGDSFRAFGGAVRVIWPGATSRDHWRKHRVFLTYATDDPQETADSISAYVSDARPVVPPSRRPAPRIEGVTPVVLDRKASPAPPAPASPAPPSQPPAAEPSPAPAPPATARPTAPIASTSSLPRPGPRPTQALSTRPAAPPRALVDTAPAIRVVEQNIRDLGSRLEHLEQLVSKLPQSLAESVRHDVAEVIHDLVGGGAPDEIDRERSRADEAEQTLDDLRRRHEKTLRELADVRHSVGAVPVVWSDPERQLRHEIELAWLVATEEEKRNGGPRGFRFGPRFLESLSADLVPRPKAVLMCAEVVSRTIHDHRTTHLVEESPGGGKHRTRADATACWRAYLKTNSPGAPRLMWWELKDGTVEFALAAHHDDLNFP